MLFLLLLAAASQKRTDDGEKNIPWNSYEQEKRTKNI